MTDDSGNLSIDFLAGFAIFMIALVYVATMIPGLLIGISSNAIDYDAVAYRTGVILVEDPGMPVDPPWQSYGVYDKDRVQRFGLAISKDTPNILSPTKVDRFFCSTIYAYPDDYHTRAIFGDYPYLFNISYTLADENLTRAIGDTRPEGYGYIRRVIKEKGESNATIGLSKITTSERYWSKENVTQHVFAIHINCSELAEETHPEYQIDPRRDQMMINITGLDQLHYPGSITKTNISKAIIYRSEPLPSEPFPPLAEVRPFTNIYIDGVLKPLPADVTGNVSLIIPPGFFYDMATKNTRLYINLTFNNHDSNNNPVEDWFLNSTVKGPFVYNYEPIEVTQPRLQDGVLEVAVW